MSITRNDQIRCDECGKFIAIEELIEGRASHHLLTPDSDWSKEEFESLCAVCNAPKLRVV